MLVGGDAFDKLFLFLGGDHSSMEKERAGLLQNMRQSLEKVDLQALRCYTKRVAELGIDPVVAIRYGLMDGMCALSEAFDEGEIFIPQLLLAAEAVEEAAHILSRQIAASDRRNMPKGKVLIYVVEGDIHDIGKTIVATVLSASGFEVVDLGRNVPAETAVTAAVQHDVNVIINFALMTTTQPVQAELIHCLLEQGLRQKFSVLVGGSLGSVRWAKEIGADAYADSVTATVELVRRLVRRQKFQRSPAFV